MVLGRCPLPPKPGGATIPEKERALPDERSIPGQTGESVVAALGGDLGSRLLRPPDIREAGVSTENLLNHELQLGENGHQAVGAFMGCTNADGLTGLRLFPPHQPHRR